MIQDDPRLGIDADRAPGLRDALHEVAGRAGQAPRLTADEVLMQRAVRTASIVRRRHRTARAALTAACAVVVLGGAVVVANLPLTAQHPHTVRAIRSAPASTATAPTCGEPLALPRGRDGLVLVSTAFPDERGRAASSSDRSRVDRIAVADARALATTMLSSIEVTNRGTTTASAVSGGEGASSTVLVHDGVVVARTTALPYPLQVSHDLRPGESRPATGISPTACATGSAGKTGPTGLAALPDGDYELYAILDPSDDRATAQAVGGPWDVQIGPGDGERPG